MNVSAIDITPPLQTEVLQSGVQHIGLVIGTEEFLLAMNAVREIIMLTAVTYVPHADVLVEGIIALRGEIMPVLNLRRAFGFSRAGATPTTRIIIIQGSPESSGNGATGVAFGILVDEITEFIWLQTGEFEDLPSGFFPAGYKLLSGVAPVGEKIKGVLDAAKLVASLAKKIEPDPQ